MPTNQQNFTRLLSSANDLANNRKFYLAIAALDEAIKYDSNDISTRWWYYFTKTQWLWNLSKYSEAIKVVDEGIEKVGYPPILLYLKADAILRKDRNFVLATQLINQAQEIFDANTPAFESQVENIPDQLQALETRITTILQFKTALSSVLMNALVIQTEETINQKVKSLEDKLEKERLNIIELLGVFTAVMALIILGGTFVTKFSMRDAVIIISALGGILLAFVVFLSITFNTQKVNKSFFGKIFDFRIWLLLGVFLYIFLIINNFQLPNFHHSSVTKNVAKQVTAKSK